MVKAGITLPASFVAKPPKGGIRLRIRAPTAHAGQMSRVAVGKTLDRVQCNRGNS